MKKIASLFLLVSLFYNVLGYHLMISDHEKQTWVATLEKSENSKFEVFQFKINPYDYIVDSGFEFVNEDLVVNKIPYHVFKKRIQKNVLQLYCIKTDAYYQINDDVRNIIDSQLFENSSSSKELPNKKTLKNFIKDYIKNDPFVFECQLTETTTGSKSCFSPKENLLTGYFFINYPPPNLV